MGYRLSKIYTRTGDDGSTGLADGARVSKASAVVEAMGAVDELNCQLGVLLAQPGLLADEQAQLKRVQHELFELGGELAMPEYQVLTDESVARLEEELDARNTALPPLTNFILPGGGPASAQAHLARAVCRRAERELVVLAEQERIRPELLHYLNRLSDWLFVAARTLARREGGEVLWRQGLRRGLKGGGGEPPPLGV